MTSQNAELALALRDEPQAVMLTNAQLNVIANTEFVPKSMRGNVPKVLACVSRGRAMGIPDAVALGGIDIIEGKASLSAELMCAIVRRHGHSIVGEVTAERAVIRGKRVDNGDEMTAEFNREMAEAAGLLNKANWKKHPDDMMWARAVSKLCRRLFADCFAGGTYSEEDLSDTEVTYDETVDEPVRLEVSDEEIQEGQWDVAVPGSTPGVSVAQALADEAAAALEALRQDFPTERIAAMARDLFPDRKSAKELTPGEIDMLRDALTPKP